MELTTANRDLAVSIDRGRSSSVERWLASAVRTGWHSAISPVQARKRIRPAFGGPNELAHNWSALRSSPEIVLVAGLSSALVRATTTATSPLTSGWRFRDSTTSTHAQVDSLGTNRRSETISEPASSEFR